MSSKLYSTLRDNLRTRFHQPEVFAGRVALAILSSTPILFHGRGGLGKSEMLRTVLKTLDFPSLIVDCHPEMAVDDLFGGAVAETLVNKGGTDDTLQRRVTSASINFDQGFMEYPVVFFEEMADLPPRTMAALKSVLTSNEWNGRKSKNFLVFGATNTSLRELESTLEPAYLRAFQAFQTRFISVEHMWHDYSSADYLGVLDSWMGAGSAPPIKTISETEIRAEIDRAASIPVPKNIRSTLAEIFATVTGEGKTFLGGRDIIFAMKLAQAYAYMQGHIEVQIGDLSVIELFEGCGHKVQELEDIAEEARRSQVARAAVEQVSKSLEEVLKIYDDASKPQYIRGLTVKKKLQGLLDEVGKVVSTDSTHNTLKALETKIETELSEVQDYLDDIELEVV